MPRPAQLLFCYQSWQLLALQIYSPKGGLDFGQKESVTEWYPSPWPLLPKLPAPGVVVPVSWLLPISSPSCGRCLLTGWHVQSIHLDNHVGEMHPAKLCRRLALKQDVCTQRCHLRLVLSVGCETQV